MLTINRWCAVCRYIYQSQLADMDVVILNVDCDIQSDKLALIKIKDASV
jgi:hypothetical protein